MVAQRCVVRYQVAAGFHSVRRRWGICQGRTGGQGGRGGWLQWQSFKGLQRDAGRCWLWPFKLCWVFYCTAADNQTKPKLWCLYCAKVWVEWKFCSSSFFHNFPNTADTLNRSKTLDMIWAALVKAGSSRSTYCQKGQVWSGEEARVALKQGRASRTTRSSGLLSFETWEFTNKIWEVILWAIWSQKKDECVSKEFFFLPCSVVGVFSRSRYLVVIRGTAGDSHLAEWLFSFKRMKNVLRPTLFHSSPQSLWSELLSWHLCDAFRSKISQKFNSNSIKNICNYLTSLQIFFSCSMTCECFFRPNSGWMWSNSESKVRFRVKPEVEIRLSFVSMKTRV